MGCAGAWQGAGECACACAWRVTVTHVLCSVDAVVEKDPFAPRGLARAVALRTPYRSLDPFLMSSSSRLACQDSMRRFRSPKVYEPMEDAEEEDAMEEALGRRACPRLGRVDGADAEGATGGGAGVVLALGLLPLDCLRRPTGTDGREGAGLLPLARVPISSLDIWTGLVGSKCCKLTRW